MTLQDEELARRLAEEERNAAQQAIWIEERDRQMALQMQSAEVCVCPTLASLRRAPSSAFVHQELCDAPLDTQTCL
jgi:hypothetical protein